MSDHFAAFSFVDRITAPAGGTVARGTFAIPGKVASFPSCLMAEAIGQLAAWVAMSRIEFRGRPVAALAHETRFLHDARPGQRLDLEVEIERADDEAVAYRGSASVDGTAALELNDCLGPMLPVDEFDDPKVMAQRFALLCDGGAREGRFGGVDVPRATRDSGVPGESARGTLAVPASAPFFNDHFPRRPVFPATLLLDAKIALAMELAAETSNWARDADITPLRMTHVKIRSFTPPGQSLEILAEMKPPKGDRATCHLTAYAEDKTVATARVEIGPRQ